MSFAQWKWPNLSRNTVTPGEFNSNFNLESTTFKLDNERHAAKKTIVQLLFPWKRREGDQMRKMQLCSEENVYSKGQAAKILFVTIYFFPTFLEYQPCHSYSVSFSKTIVCNCKLGCIIADYTFFLFIKKQIFICVNRLGCHCLLFCQLFYAKYLNQ